jgi:putative ABC transport system substrate-binding protein
MKRREFITFLGSVAAAWPTVARAQVGTKLPLVAVLFPSSEALLRERLAFVREGMKSEGLIEGRHYVLDARFSDGDTSRLPELARQLDALGPKVFVASASAAAFVHQLLPGRPLVFTAVAVDPIAFGFAESYTHPGGAATGCVMNAVGGEESLTAKRLGFFATWSPESNELACSALPRSPVSNEACW